MIKISGNVLSGPSVNSINEHIRSGTFPAEFKCANLVLLHKNNPNNHQPMSLFPSVSKIFGSVLYNGLLDYFTYFNLCFCNQFGFSPKNSTVDELVHITEPIRHDLTHGYELPVAVFLYLKKAFDKVDNSILIKRIRIIWNLRLSSILPVELFRKEVKNC